MVSLADSRRTRPADALLTRVTAFSLDHPWWTIALTTTRRRGQSPDARPDSTLSVNRGEEV